MIELQGKYNYCKVFTDNCGDETIAQLINLLNQPYVEGEQVRIMPDTHAGKGSTIGTTMTLRNQRVCVNTVGVDIGCGMLAMKLEDTDIDFAKLDAVIHEQIPSGGEIHDHAIQTFPKLQEIFAPIRMERAKRSIGTLGGGNHFIEMDRDSTGYLWLVIHSGSRHLGIEVCDHYQSLAYEQACSRLLPPSFHGKTKNEIVQELIVSLKAQGKESEIQTEIQKLNRKFQEISVQLSGIRDFAYIEGKVFDDYIHDMRITQEFAALNRETMARQIVEGMHLRPVEVFTTVHNYIDCDQMILRKGAVSAALEEKLIIPINMRDGSLICKGKGNPDWNFSAPHGAGRTMSRRKAKAVVSLEAFQDSMAGIYSTCVRPETLDESPFVYKPMDEIVKNIQESVQVVDTVRPVYNFKACEQHQMRERAAESEYTRE